MKLPRPKFALKTLFVAITPICVFLYWVETQRAIVKERADFYSRLRESSLFLDRTWALSNGASNPEDVPWIRQLLGDRAFYQIDLPANCDANTQSSALTLFPEAKCI